MPARGLRFLLLGLALWIKFGYHLAMGKVAILRPPELHVRVARPVLQRVTEAAKRIDQPITVWLRMAIMEKLARDGG